MYYDERIWENLENLREDVKIPTYKPQKVLCEVTYFSPNQHM